MPARQVHIDSATNHAVHSEEHRFLVTLLDDAVFFGLAVYAFHATGVDRFFVPGFMGDRATMEQLVRYGLLLGTMLEVRRLLEQVGIPTDLISQTLDWYL